MELTQAAAKSYHTISHIILTNKMNIKSHKLYFFSPNRLLLVFVGYKFYYVVYKLTINRPQKHYHTWVYILTY